MKATELQIGDWVKSRTGMNVKIVGINHDYPSVYEPIPLTPEILEKNGFKCVDIYKVYEKHAFGTHIELNYWEGMVRGISISVTDKNAINTSNTDITRDRNVYVHELQHALCLCGLNDLADNFKI